MESEWNLNSDDKTVNLGNTGVLIQEDVLARCNHSTFSLLVSDLLLHLFGRQTLGDSSMTGKVSNISKNKDVQAKKPLDPVTLEAIKCNYNFYLIFIELYTIFTYLDLLSLL